MAQRETHDDPHGGRPHAGKPDPGKPPADKRDRIVDASLALAAERPFGEIALRDIAERAGVTLGDFRDAFPSKGAVLAGYVRRIDHAVLDAPVAFRDDEAPRDRLFDVLMRRFDAMAADKAALRSIFAWARQEPLAAA
ncbi:MAG: TetR/AcrR family transcriptional regulator, partial [Hyphomicrobiales bacterium]|nr:TetR/AcrR family transcriptional regulator [Hyphomicrobiales bacterium]